MIRYVDDTMIVFKNKNKLTNKEIFKELSLFLNNELMIRIYEEFNLYIDKNIDELFKDNKEEVLIRKFYDRRNFNPVSHPSKNGKASVKISNEILEEFEDKIIEILLKIINKGEN